jgi:hypothetical protein
LKKRFSTCFSFIFVIKLSTISMRCYEPRSLVLYLNFFQAAKKPVLSPFLHMPWTMVLHSSCAAFLLPFIMTIYVLVVLEHVTVPSLIYNNVHSFTYMYMPLCPLYLMSCTEQQLWAYFLYTVRNVLFLGMMLHCYNIYARSAGMPALLLRAGRRNP